MQVNEHNFVWQDMGAFMSRRLCWQGAAVVIPQGLKE